MKPENQPKLKLIRKKQKKRTKKKEKKQKVKENMEPYISLKRILYR